MPDTPPLAGQVVVFAGALNRLSRREAVSCVERQHGRVASAVTRDTTLLVLGETVADAVAAGGPVERLDARRLQDAHKWNLRSPDRVRVIPAERFYDLIGLEAAPAGGSAEPARASYSARTIRGLYPALRDDRLRYLERWGLIRPLGPRAAGRHERVYAFADLAVLRQASAELARGLPFRAVVRDLLAERQGQLSFDFQPGTGEPTPAKVIALPRRTATPASAPDRPQPDAHALSLAAAYFAEGAELDSGDEAQRTAAMEAYRRALALDPSMTAALVNLANVHYALDQIVEAEALYEKALVQDPGCFEAHFNLGNVYHDTGRFELAARCYTGALAIDPGYADAHFYLAVTLEKLGRSSDARPHWSAYQRLAPNGEWVELAREFSE
jgi:tetratricopeptide (TPR) repeat protein